MTRPFSESWYLYYVLSSPTLKVKWKNYNFTEDFKWANNVRNEGSLIIIHKNNSYFFKVVNVSLVIGNLKTISKLPNNSYDNTALIYNRDIKIESQKFLRNFINKILIDNQKWIEELILTLPNFTIKYLTLQSELSNPNKGWAYDTNSWWHYSEIAALTPYYGINTVLTSANKVHINTSFNINKSNNYKLLIRYFKNQKGGGIKVYIDGKPTEINTKGQLNKFVWKDLGTFYLEKGKHELILENVNGFNAANLFVLIPEEEYYKAKEKVEKLLQNKTLIYLFEAEADLYRTNAEITKNINASNGEALLLGENSKAWQDIEIVKNGTYRIALKGIGKFKVKVGNYSSILKLNSLNYTYSPMFYLDEGKYRLEIVHLNVKNPVLDVIWLYSTETNQTIEQLFEMREKPAEVINYTKINPTLWKVKVNAAKPFTLSFAEAYDPIWEARVYKDGKKVETVKSIPLYSVINGFWINETGELEIVIRYKPQDWFERGLIISATTFIGCIGYLFYDWRRGKGDRWTKRLEKKIRRYLESIKKKLTTS